MVATQRHPTHQDHTLHLVFTLPDMLNPEYLTILHSSNPFQDFIERQLTLKYLL